MAMQDSDFTESDVSHMGSDDEPPSDSVLDKVVIAHKVNAVKYLIQIGKGYDKPGSGDVIKIRWTPFTKKSFLTCLSLQKSCALHELMALNKEIQESFSETGITACGELGYNVGIPLVIEETIKTMKNHEICVVLCDNRKDWIEGCEKTTRLAELPKRYDLFCQDKKKKKLLLKKLYRKDEEEMLHYVAFAIHLETFSKRFALNEERTILMESLVDAFPGAVSPKKYDTIRYSWYILDEESNAKPSWNHSLTRLCEDALSPNAKICSALLSMKVNQTCKIFLRELNGQKICTVCVRLEHVFSNDLILCKDPWNLSSYGTHQLKCQEFVECQEGMKKQLIVEEGCRVVALLSLRSMHEQCFGPFHCIHDFTKKSSKASLVSWTLGSNSVPYWIDTIVVNMKPRCRVRVALQSKSFMLSETVITPSLWHTFYETVLAKNDTWAEFNPKDVQDVLEWNEIYLCCENSLKDSIEAWLNAAPAKENLNLMHLFESKHETFLQILHHLDITHNIETLLNSQWILKNGSLNQIQFLSSWLCQPKNIAKWTSCDSFLRSNSHDECFLDIQLIEILNRQPKQWTITESNRLIWGTLYKLFANYLLQKQYWNLALKYYKKALESIRFSPLLDCLKYCEAPQQNTLMTPIITRKDVDTVSLEPIEDLYQCIMCNIIQLYVSSKRWIDAIHATKNIKKISKPMYIKALHRLTVAYFNNYTQSRTILTQCCLLDPCNNEFKKLLKKIDLAIRDSTQQEKNLFKDIFVNERRTNTLITVNKDA